MDNIKTYADAAREAEKLGLPYKGKVFGVIKNMIREARAKAPAKAPTKVPAPNFNNLVKVSTYAKQINKSVTWVQMLINDGKVKSVKIDGVNFVDLSK